MLRWRCLTGAGVCLRYRCSARRVQNGDWCSQTIVISRWQKGGYRRCPHTHTAFNQAWHKQEIALMMPRWRRLNLTEFHIQGRWASPAAAGVVFLLKPNKYVVFSTIFVVLCSFKRTVSKAQRDPVYGRHVRPAGWQSVREALRLLRKRLVVRNQHKQPLLGGGGGGGRWKRGRVLEAQPLYIIRHLTHFVP